MRPIVAFIFSFILEISTSIENSDVFASVPQDDPYYVREGAPGPTLKCSLQKEFLNRTRYEVTWTRYNKGLSIVSRGDQWIEKEHFELVGNPSLGVYDLKVKNLGREFAEGSYQCSVVDLKLSGTQYKSKPAEVIALVPPGDPRVVEAPSESIVEGEMVTFKCSSSGGSPNPTFSWSFLNGSIADSKYLNTFTKGGETESTLHFRVRPEDNGAFLTCGVINKAMLDNHTKDVDTPRLNVLFKPRVHVAPVQDLTVEVGQIVQLICTADANPTPPSYEWKHLSSGERYVASKWPLTADKKMSGEFECRARNSVGEGNDVLTLTVQYAPEVTTKERINPNEGERVEVECLVDANPKASVIKWSGPNGFSSDDPTLVLKSVSRENSGNYTCLATNYLNIYGQTGSQTRTGTSITFVDVKRRPGKAVISPSHLNVVVGDIIELLCSAADLGSPEAQFKWSSPSSGGQFGTREHDQASLIVRNAQLADNGRYRCRAYNSLGEGDEAVVDVKVIEPAKISRPLATERIFQANEAANGLECEAEGYPVPSFQWFKDGQPIDQERYKTESTIVKTSCSERDFCTLIVMGSLFFSIPIQWTDKGNYSCVASNGASERNSNNLSWTVVRVIHGPVILNQRFPIDSLAAADVLSMARLKCIVSARPEPKFSWMFSSSVIEETDRYSFQFNRIYERPDEYEHILQISETVDTDYGSYLCRATNGVGTKAEVIVRLTHTGLPQVPDAVQKLSSTPQSLLIGWQPGFDGGFEQSFVVEYRLLNPFTESFGKEDVATVEVHNVTKIEEIKDDGTISWIISYNLTGLRPLSSYYVRTRAANKKGISEFSPLVIATTNDVNEDPKMLAPRSLSFDILKQSIHVEPRSPSDGCILLYVSSGDKWRSAGCYPPDHSISNLPGGSLFRARFCSRQDPLRCSKMSSVLESSSAITPWRLALIIPVAALAFLILLMCALFVICFRSRSPTKIVKNGPSTITVLSQSEAKNAMVHGSQTDSGVFTLDSGRIKGNNFIAPHTYSSSSEETAVENWPPEQYDITNDPYLSEQARHVFPGDMDDQMEEASISGTEDEDGRRVMREIIV